MKLLLKLRSQLVDIGVRGVVTVNEPHETEMFVNSPEVIHDVLIISFYDLSFKIIFLNRNGRKLELNNLC